MNSDDKNSLKAFKSMFAGLSRSVKRNYEAKARERVRDATPEENAIPPIAGIGPGTANVVPLANFRGATPRP